MKKNKNSIKGFSIVELIVYMAVLVILLGVLSDIFLSSLDLQTQSAAHSTVQQDGGYIINRLTYDIARSESIVIPATQGGVSNSLTITIDGTQNTYGLNGAALMLTNNYGSNRMNSTFSDVSNVSFTRRGNAGGHDTISVRFTVSEVYKQKTRSDIKTFETTIGTR